MAHLEMCGLGKRYGSFQALHPIDLALESGEFVAVLGPSGCGKTTLLMLLAGLLEPSCGSVRLDGRDITGLPAEKRGMGMVFQHYALFPHLSVADNIMYGLRGPDWNRTRRLERLEEMLELTSLRPFAARHPADLSGGQQQRAALARALAPRPSLLLLDEPLSALDALHRVALGEELRAIQRRAGLTAVMVTHDRSEALSLADTVVVLRQGKLEQTGSPQDVYDAPKTAFVASFVGEMNMLNLPAIRSGHTVGIRYEDVEVDAPSELSLSRPYTWVGRVERASFRGPVVRLELLLNDFVTRVRADVPRGSLTRRSLEEERLFAVTLPENRWHWWNA